MSDLENRIAAQPGPKVTPQDVKDAFVSCDYHVFPGTTTTVALATMKNGFRIVGQSACADPANFREDIGRELALKDCERQVWAFLGYGLRQRLHDAT
jgi:hypothetical protein